MAGKSKLGPGKGQSQSPGTSQEMLRDWPTDGTYSYGYTCCGYDWCAVSRGTAGTGHCAGFGLASGSLSACLGGVPHQSLSAVKQAPEAAAALLYWAGGLGLPNVVGGGACVNVCIKVAVLVEVSTP